MALFLLHLMPQSSAQRHLSISTFNVSSIFYQLSTLVLTSTEYWDVFVGPVAKANITTTVSATPVATSELVPPPPLYYAPQTPGAQNALVSKNENWKFPSGFWWGVASAAYQVEGAAADEGRGPSVWDVFTHNAAAKITVANDTGDVSVNQYYLYKQGKSRAHVEASVDD